MQLLLEMFLNGVVEDWRWKCYWESNVAEDCYCNYDHTVLVMYLYGRLDLLVKHRGQ